MGDEASDSVLAIIGQSYTEAKNLQKKPADESQEAALERTSKATQLLDDAVAKVDGLLESSPDSAKLLGMKCSLLYERAKVLASTGDIVRAREALSAASELAQCKAVEPEVVYVMLRVVNHLSYLLAKDGELDKPRALLEQAAGFYKQFKRSDPPPAVFTGDDLFQQPQPAEGSLDKLERLATNNFQMLGFVRNKQGDLDGFVRCHHLVLRRQLELGDADPPLWAAKVARLAAHFLDRGRLAAARHHLAAASVALDAHEAGLGDGDDDDAARQEFSKVSADLAKGWVKYAMSLFTESRDRLRTQGSENPFLQAFSPQASPLDVIPENDAVTSVNDVESVKLDGDENKPEAEEVVVEEDPTTAPEDENLATEEDLEAESGDSLKFPSLQTATFESGVPSACVETPEQARALFRFAHVWLRHAAEYYNLRDRPGEHVDAVIELSELYRHLAFFERDPAGRYDVQRRRADTLETLCALVRELRPQCYAAVGVELLWELTEVQLELLGLDFRGLFGAVDDGCGDFAQLLDGVDAAGVPNLGHLGYSTEFCLGPIDPRYIYHRGDFMGSVDAAPGSSLDASGEATAAAEAQLEDLTGLGLVSDVGLLARAPGTYASQDAAKPEEHTETASTCSAESEKATPREPEVTPSVA